MNIEDGESDETRQIQPGLRQQGENLMTASPEPGNTEKSLWKFRLYITGDAPQSRMARINLDALCSQHLEGNCHIEIIDLLREPDRYVQDEILVIPTLVRYSPDPVCTLVGNLSNTEDVLLALGL